MPKQPTKAAKAAPTVEKTPEQLEAERIAALPVDDSDMPDDLKKEGGFDKRPFLDRNRRRFWLKLNPDHDRGKTHFVKNATHTWEGTEEEFRQAFERE